MAKALIIDDEKDIRELIEMAFISIGIDCVLAANIKEGISRLKKGGLDFCITDMRLPDGDGLDLVAYIQKNYPSLPVCVITAHGNVELAVKALKLGAFDFVNKPFDLKQLREMANSAIKLIENTNSTLNTSSDATPTNNISLKTGKKNQPATELDKYRIIGKSPAIVQLTELIKKLARSQAPVFIHGESGTGKELVARNIHHLSARHDQPFIAINCGAIPENLVESEFFGYKKGAFTGANQDYPGLFVSANNGTLFLDEIADLPLNMQVKLLRAIQEKAIRPIGGNQEINVNVRILSATHKDLQQLVNNKTFREDLYYRLNVISLDIPPLRDREDDIIFIANSILIKLAQLHNRQPIKLSASAINLLKNYEFPGNVRELENILERAITFCEGDILQEKDFSFSEKAPKLDMNTWSKIPVTPKEPEPEYKLSLADLDNFLPFANKEPIKEPEKNYIEQDNSLSFNDLYIAEKPLQEILSDSEIAALNNQPDDNVVESKNVENSELIEDVDYIKNTEHTEHTEIVEDIDDDIEEDFGDDVGENIGDDLGNDIENIEDLDKHMAIIERNLIMKVLKSTNNNKTKAAEKLGISFRAFRYKLQKYQIK